MPQSAPLAEASPEVAPEITRILALPAFAQLRAKRTGLALKLSAAMLLIYYGFVLMVAFSPATLAKPVAGHISLGIVLGLAVIVSAIVLTGIYVRRANSEFDGLTQEIIGGLK